MGAEWRTFDHTGDLGLEVWADTKEELFEGAAVALSAQIARADAGPVEIRHALELEGDDPADLLVHWLNTSLLEAEIRRAVWTEARVSALTDTTISATLGGPRRDPSRQEFLREIKAVSHHHLALELASYPCRCRLILDL
jgi:SHS2 domain-containing protein